MEEKKPILFLMHEGIPSTIFESQVLQHAKEIKKKGFEIEIISFNTDFKTEQLSLKNLNKIIKEHPDLKIKLLNTKSIYLPFSFITHRKKLLENVNPNDYNSIHCRSDYSTFIAIISFYRNNLSKIIWDCRGDSLDELLYALKFKNILIKLYGYFYLVPLQKLVIAINTALTRKRIFVSESLKKLFSPHNSTSYVIPCSFSEDLFYYCKFTRANVRKTLGYNVEDMVFVYSGSLINYSEISKIARFIKQHLIAPNVKVLILTKDIEKANQILKVISPENILIIDSPFETMNQYLNAADCAILFRNKRRLNIVASPTKFGEYSALGLPVITEGTVEQIKEFGAIMNNVFDSPSKIIAHNYDREKVAIKAKSLYSRKKYLDNYISLYA